MTRNASHAVLSLGLGRHVVPISWGSLTLVQDEPSPGVYGLMSWSLDAALAEFDFLDPADYEVRAELDNGEVLVGHAILTNTNSWRIALMGNGPTAGIAGW